MNILYDIALRYAQKQLLQSGTVDEEFYNFIASFNDTEEKEFVAFEIFRNFCSNNNNPNIVNKLVSSKDGLIGEIDNKYDAYLRAAMVNMIYFIDHESMECKFNCAESLKILKKFTLLNIRNIHIVNNFRCAYFIGSNSSIITALKELDFVILGQNSEEVKSMVINGDNLEYLSGLHLLGITIKNCAFKNSKDLLVLRKLLYASYVQDINIKLTECKFVRVVGADGCTLDCVCKRSSYLKMTDFMDSEIIISNSDDVTIDITRADKTIIRVYKSKLKIKMNCYFADTLDIHLYDSSVELELLGSINNVKVSVYEHYGNKRKLEVIHKLPRIDCITSTSAQLNRKYSIGRYEQ